MAGGKHFNRFNHQYSRMGNFRVGRRSSCITLVLMIVAAIASFMVIRLLIPEIKTSISKYVPGTMDVKFSFGRKKHKQEAQQDEEEEVEVLAERLCPTLTAEYFNVTKLIDEPLKNYVCSNITSDFFTRTLAPKDKFNVDICFSKKHCGRGYFHIKRVGNASLEACHDAISRRVSDNEETEAYIKNTLGPDFFYITITGSEKQAMERVYHLGNCEYKSPFQLLNPGVQEYLVRLAYDNYMPVNETRDQTPINRMIHLAQLAVDANCPHCTTHTAASLSSVRNLPVCPRGVGVPPPKGVYVKMTGETPREVYKISQGWPPYLWVPLGCHLDQTFELGVNDPCLHQLARKGGHYPIGFHPEDAEILQDPPAVSHIKPGFGVMFSGDSHVRFQYDMVAQRFAAETDPVEKLKMAYKVEDIFMDPGTGRRVFNGETRPMWRDDDPEESKNWAIRLEYVAQVWQEPLAMYHWPTTMPVDNRLEWDHYFDMLDVLVIGLGSWPMSRPSDGGHWGLMRYKYYLEFCLETMHMINRKRRRHGMKPLRLVWNGLPSYGIQLDPAYIAVKEIRNPYLLRLWADIAEDVMKKRGVEYLDIWALSYPWLEQSLDIAHYHQTPALDAWADVMLHILNICNA